MMSFFRVRNQSFLSSSSFTTRSRFESSTMQNSSIQFSKQSEQFSFSLIYIDFDSFFLFQTFFSFSSESKENAKSKHSDHLNNDVQKNNSNHLSNDNSIVNQSTTNILHETSRFFCVCDELIHDRRANKTIVNEIVQIASFQKRTSFQKKKKQMLSRSWWILRNIDVWCKTIVQNRFSTSMFFYIFRQCYNATTRFETIET